MKDWMIPLAWLCFVVSCMVGMFLWERAIWRECRAGGHSFIYCMRMVHR